MKQIQVGLLVDEISNVFSQLICQGAYDACQKAGVKLSIFFGGYYMNTFKEYDYQKNMIYPLANSTDLDFLIVSIASICRSLTNKQKILEYFNHVPLVTLNEGFEGISAVLIDNESGLEKGIRYIIENTTHRKFAMVACSNNPGSNLRQGVFERVLKEYGLEEEIYVEQAPIMERSSTAAIRAIFKKKPQTDVIVCVNDELAIATYKVCEEIGKKVGKDVYVLGFDDIHDASCLQPALASIRSPIEGLGYQAVINGIEQISTKQTFTQRLSTEFILRNSLGNAGEDVEQYLYHMRKLFNKQSTFEQFMEYIKKDLHVENDLLEDLLYYIYTCDLNRMNSYDQIKEKIQNIFASHSKYRRIDIMTILHILERFLHYYIFHTKYENEERYIFALHQYENVSLMIISLFNTNLNQFENSRYEDNLQVNALARKVMMFANTRECHENILQAISELDIQNAQVYLFDRAVEHESYTALSEPLYLMGHIVNGKRELLPKRVVYALEHLVAKTSDWQTNRPVSIVSIYSNTKLYGYILCDVELENYTKLEFLNIHIATSLDTLRLMSDLKYHSRRDSLTGLFNRRGLEEKLDEYFTNEKDEGEYYIVVADIDNLKKINDCYGHKAGDVAIQKGSKILQLAFGKKAFIVRMGGDEFLTILNNKTEEDIRISLENAQNKVNQNIVQPIPTCFSYGVQKMERKEHLQDFIKEADRLMYLHKQTKKKGN